MAYDRIRDNHRSRGGITIDFDSGKSYEGDIPNAVYEKFKKASNKEEFFYTYLEQYVTPLNQEIDDEDD